MNGGQAGEPCEELRADVAAVPRPRWGIADALAGLLLGFLVSAIASTVWAAATGQTSTEELSLVGVIVLQLGLWSGFIGVVIFAARVKGSGSLVRDFGLAARGRDVLVGIPIGVVAQLGLVPLLYLPFKVDADKLNKPAKEMADKAHGPAFLVLALVLAIGAPLVEELFFRGLLLRAVANRFGTGWGVAGSSVLFALVHFEALQFPALLIFGIVLGVLAVRTGRLGPGIAAHAAFNLVAIVALR